MIKNQQEFNRLEKYLCVIWDALATQCWICFFFIAKAKYFIIFSKIIAIKRFLKQKIWLANIFGLERYDDEKIFNSNNYLINYDSLSNLCIFFCNVFFYCCTLEAVVLTRFESTYIQWTVVWIEIVTNDKNEFNASW